MPTDNPDVKKNVHPPEAAETKAADLDQDRTVLAGRVLDDPPKAYVDGEEV